MSSINPTYKKIIIPILILVIVTGIFAPQYQVNAAIGGYIPQGNAGVTSTDDTGSYWWQFCPFSLIDCANIIRQGTGHAITWSAGLLDSVIQLSSFDPPSQVKQSWTTIRDFMNMLFILALIVLAFGTIFDIDKYSVRGRGVFVNFLIAAIFINFSFAIGKYILDVSNGLASMFLKIIQNGNVPLSVTLGNGLAFGKLGSPGAANMTYLLDASRNSSPLITSVFFIIFMVIALMAMLSAAIFAIVRIPFIWFLLIVSPFAWFSYALPSLKDAAWGRWWKEFLCWCFFLPTYIFILTFAAIFINAKKSGITAIDAQQAVLINPANGTFISNIFQVMGLNDIFFFIVTLIIMVGGLGFARKIACTGGGMAMTAFGKIEGGVKGALAGTGRFAWRASGGQARYEGAKEGLKARGEQIKEGGILGIGGGQAARLKQAAWAEKFGGIKTRGIADKQLSDEVNKLKGDYERITNVDDLKKMIDKGSRQQQLAVREVLKSRDELDAIELVKTFEMYGGSESLTALKFARGIDYGAMSSAGRKHMFNNINDAEIKRRIALVRAEKEDYKRGPEANSENLKNVASLFIQEGDRAAFLNKVRRTNMKNAVEALADMGLYKDKKDNKLNRNDALINAMSSMNLDSILEISADDLVEMMRTNSEVAEIIKNKITKENLGIIKAKANKQQLEAGVLGDLINDREQEIKTTEQEKLDKQAEAQIKGNQPLAEAIEKLAKQQQTQPPPPQAPPQAPPPAQPPPSSNLVDQNNRPINQNNIVDLKNNK